MGETEKRRRLRRDRMITTAMLPVVAVLLVVASHLKVRFPPLAWVQAFAEAALIGGLADWFAVVALFRQPLGLPLPHTALVRRNKDRIGRELGRFVEENFLTPETISAWLARRDVVGIALRAGTNAATVKSVLRGATEIWTLAGDAAMEAGVPACARRLLAAVISHVDPGAALAKLLRAILASGAERSVLDCGLMLLSGLLEGNRVELRIRFGKRSPLTSSIFDSFVVNRFVDGAIDVAGEIAADPEHKARAQFSAWLENLVVRLETDAALRAQVAAPLQRVISDGRLGALIEQLWCTAGGSVTGFEQDAIAEAIARSCREMLRDRRMIAVVNARLARALAAALSGTRLRLSTLVEDVVRAWDSQFLTDKLELEVGRDLQFIRINGMAVGGLAGVVLHPLLALAGIN
ncbi:MAG TPA: DUF445 domain-containing protein [Acetobacteraceae bacterium]|jgi:uncharacterized membrane-anchored protein YjiN (DUF445 family)|nr:DUF445 domain-containing protein [Acetobacteraceae bacterium]